MVKHIIPQIFVPRHHRLCRRAHFQTLEPVCWGCFQTRSGDGQRHYDKNQGWALVIPCCQSDWYLPGSCGQSGILHAGDSSFQIDCEYSCYLLTSMDKRQFPYPSRLARRQTCLCLAGSPYLSCPPCREHRTEWQTLPKVQRFLLSGMQHDCAGDICLHLPLHDGNCFSSLCLKMPYDHGVFHISGIKMVMHRGLDRDIAGFGKSTMDFVPFTL